MAQLDDQIKVWLKEKFLQSGRYYPATQGGYEDIEILKVDMAWDCGCHSEYTRDDTFKLTAQIRGANGHVFEWSYGQWGDLPQYIEELDEYINGDDCRFNDEEY